MEVTEIYFNILFVVYCENGKSNLTIKIAVTSPCWGDADPLTLVHGVSIIIIVLFSTATCAFIPDIGDNLANNVDQKLSTVPCYIEHY